MPARASRRLRASTAAVYRNIIEAFRAEHGHKSVKGMEPRHVHALIESKASAHTRKRLLNLISILMQHAVDLGWRDDNPARDVKVRVPQTDGHATWSEDQIAAYRVHYALGTRERLVFELALNTGQRRGDLVRMGWQHVASNEITFARVRRTRR